jgi:hypothetical protein
MGFEEDGLEAMPIVRMIEGSIEALISWQGDNYGLNCGTCTLNRGAVYSFI